MNVCVGIGSQHAALHAKLRAALPRLRSPASAFESAHFDAKKAGLGSDAPDLAKTIATSKVQFVETVLPALTPEQRPKLGQYLERHSANVEDDF